MKLCSIILLLGCVVANGQYVTDAFVATTNEVFDGLNNVKPITPATAKFIQGLSSGGTTYTATAPIVITGSVISAPMAVTANSDATLNSLTFFDPDGSESDYTILSGVSGLQGYFSPDNQTYQLDPLSGDLTLHGSISSDAGKISSDGAGNMTAGTYTGNGSGLTGIPLTGLQTLPLTTIPVGATNRFVLTNDTRSLNLSGAVTISSGTFSGNGGGLTGLTIPVTTTNYFTPTNFSGTLFAANIIATNGTVSATGQTNSLNYINMGASSFLWASADAQLTIGKSPNGTRTAAHIYAYDLTVTSSSGIALGNNTVNLSAGGNNSYLYVTTPGVFNGTITATNGFVWPKTNAAPTGVTWGVTAPDYWVTNSVGGVLVLMPCWINH